MLHIYNRRINKERAFRCREDVERFRGLILKCSAKYGVEIDSYVIMDNHFHLLAEGRSVSVFMKSLQRAYAQYFNRKYGRSGRFFEKSFKSKIVDSVGYLKNMKRYLLLNPVDRVLEMEVREMVYCHRGLMLGSMEKNWP